VAYTTPLNLSLLEFLEYTLSSVKTILWVSLPAKFEYYPIRVEGTLYINSRFT
jgi:hypothetical protein